VAGLKVWGGDAKVVASNAEIERVLSGLQSCESWLRQMIEPADYLRQPGKRLAVGLELPRVFERLNWLQLSCRSAGEAYFQGESELVGDIPALAGAAVDAGLFRETEVSVVEVSAPVGAAADSGAVGAPAPTSIAEMIEILGQVDDAAAEKIRVDRLTPVLAPGGPAGSFGFEADGQNLTTAGALFLAYIPGTQIWSATAGKNVFDATSNVAAMASRNSAASERAVDQALRQAGAGRGDRVILVGHSQGGIVAGNLASRQGYQSHDAKARGTGYQVAGLVTIGAPIGQLANLNRVPTLSIEHTNDLVPKLDNQPNPLQANWVTATREVRAEGLTGPHEISKYRETAGLVDRSASSGLADIRSQILGVVRGHQIEKSSWYQLNRVLENAK
jgi:pimeloyl-ACP methyl ester carboxylesterase